MLSTEMITLFIFTLISHSKGCWHNVEHILSFQCKFPLLEHVLISRTIFSCEGAAATYLKGLYDAAMRAKKGKLEAHKDLCRRQGRMRDVSCFHYDTLVHAITHL